MSYRFLISGNRAHFTTLALDLDRKELSVLAEFPAPFNVSWVERSSSQGTIDRLVGLSEGHHSGLLYSFEIDHMHKTCTITSQKSTLGAPAHFMTLQNKSALALATYWGGSVALYPISITDTDGLLLSDARRTEVWPEFPYAQAEHGPNAGRQRQCHLHQVLQVKRGLLYAPDLGADRVWIFRGDNMKLEVCGWLQCPPGTGPRHAALTPDETIMYVLGELSHTVVAFDLCNSPAEAIPPIDGFSINIIPSTAPPDHHFMMDSAELCLHPNNPNVLYASNRWEMHIAQREPRLNPVLGEQPAGDAVAIILLSQDGRKVEDLKQVRTGLDVIRGMRPSNDGKYVVVAGQEGGGVEIYGITGERGDVWTPVTRLNVGLENGIKHAIWL